VKKLVCGPPFLICQVQFAKHLEMNYFSTCHIVFGLGKQQELPNKKCKTIGDALIPLYLEDGRW
jgi:hypothetical protein